MTKFGCQISVTIQKDVHAYFLHYFYEGKEKKECSLNASVHFVKTATVPNNGKVSLCLHSHWQNN